MPRLRVALCQLNQTVGDLEGNVGRVLGMYGRAEEAGCDLAVFPELAITGYPPEDLVLKPGFVRDNREALEKVAVATGRCAAVVGFVDEGRDLHNAAAVCSGGRVLGTYRKRLLPNYAVFDEQRYFAPGPEPLELYGFGGTEVGITICEDVWSPKGPMQEQAAGGAEVVVNLSASPYYRGRWAERERMLATRCTDSSCALVYVNLVGGQDDLLFDGGSLVFDADGTLLARLPVLEEAFAVVELDVRPVFRKRLLDPRGRAAAPALPVIQSSPTEPGRPRLEARPDLVEPPDEILELHRALVLGTRDYVTKSGFADVVIGLSGGIDSTLVACIAVEALGPEHVHGVAMPSRYSSDSSEGDAAALARNLGIDFRTIAIESAHAALLKMTSIDGLAEENVQSRIRGVTLMALSNQYGWMVLTTGNKSELAVGYSTLYGDTAGGFAVIKDVPKTLVFRLTAAINDRAGHAVVPPEVLTKPPSAELRPDQRDDESLPPYDILDPLLEAYVERDMTKADLLEAGFDPELVDRVTRLVDLAEYKRRQSPLGVRVTPKSFGKDRRVPIVNRYRG
ncbi:MAG: NAD+ synthase [Acidimicrobiales bacterium]